MVLRLRPADMAPAVPPRLRTLVPSPVLLPACPPPPPTHTHTCPCPAAPGMRWVGLRFLASFGNGKLVQHTTGKWVQQTTPNAPTQLLSKGPPIPHLQDVCHGRQDPPGISPSAPPSPTSCSDMLPVITHGLPGCPCTAGDLSLAPGTWRRVGAGLTPWCPSL